MTLDVTMLEEFDDRFVIGGGWNFKEEDHRCFKKKEIWIFGGDTIIFMEISMNHNLISTDNITTRLGTTNERWGRELVSCCSGYVFPIQRKRGGWPASLTLQRPI